MNDKELKPDDLIIIKEEIEELEVQGIKALQVLFDITNKIRIMLHKFDI